MRADRLAAVLRVRRLQEQRARGALATSNAERMRASTEERLAVDAVAARADAVRASTSADDLRAVSQIVASGLLAVDARRRTTETATLVVRDRTDEWSQTARRVDAMERLESRVLEADRLERDRRERAESDDLAAERHRRGQEPAR